MHGWLHFEAWKNFAYSIGMSQFAPYNATSTAAAAMQSSFIMPVLYFVGILACVFHFANGLWTMGITWGIWTSPKAQQRASMICGSVGIVILAIGMSALFGFMTTDVEAAREREERMYLQRVEDGSIIENEEKLSDESRERLAAEKGKSKFE
jgi:succinate dehydrogenase / fumarate reductase cytochrome b subunit